MVGVIGKVSEQMPMMCGEMTYTIGSGGWGERAAAASPPEGAGDRAEGPRGGHSCVQLVPHPSTDQSVLERKTNKRGRQPPSTALQLR